MWNAFQVVFVYFMFPETSGRTLEELTFRERVMSLRVCRRLMHNSSIVYEGDQELLQDAEAEALRGYRETETYGTIGNDSRIGQSE